MSYEVDHVFVMTAPGAPAADGLVEAGLTEGASRTHPGQGTTNRRFFFENAMLEFLWVHDRDEAESEAMRPTHLLERWTRRDGDASPFGLCFRPADTAVETPPFPAWDYEPPYLPADRDIQVGDNAGVVSEPFLFYLSWGCSPSDPPEHDAGLTALTSVTLHTPTADTPSDALSAVSRLVDIEPAETHRMTLVFDDGGRGETLDIRPDAPLVMRY
ncbi:VOC family protein [Salinigranum salinum]|uniref:VOC family protein n=1 Tax=Salinigranum salinum TaxID=1364937 RepID=UPI001260DBBE|nr:VOC family protein [Salinigranum salinum]